MLNEGNEGTRSNDVGKTAEIARNLTEDKRKESTLGSSTRLDMESTTEEPVDAETKPNKYVATSSSRTPKSAYDV